MITYHCRPGDCQPFEHRSSCSHGPVGRRCAAGRAWIELHAGKQFSLNCEKSMLVHGKKRGALMTCS